jgi:DNA-binding transcriptional LysR family regulator
MFLRQFQYLIALEQERHFSRAAERCFVSQPGLSSAIKKLEEELGVPIILRDQKFRGFTKDG